MKEKYSDKQLKLELFAIAMKRCDEKTKRDEILKKMGAWENYHISKRRRLKIIITVLTLLIIVLFVALIA